MDLPQYFKGKDNDKNIVVKMKQKYGVVKDTRAYVIGTINEQAVRIITKFLTLKIVQKNIPN